MHTRTVIIAAGAIVAIMGWYLFRPELLVINRSVNETLPGTLAQQTTTANAARTVLASGSFHSVAHNTKGLATVYQLPDGKRVVRFTEFETSNGPDVQVYLVASHDATNNETVIKAGFRSLGALKGNRGDQNYDVPIDVDLNTYRAVTVWCRRFGVNFGTAPLVQEQRKALEARQ